MACARWEKYRKLSRLGHGAYGMVYLAERRSSSVVGTGEETPRAVGKVAMKCVMVKTLAEKDVQAAANEVSVLSSLTHPNIIEYYEYTLDDDGFLNIVMEYASEGDLAHFISRHKENGSSIDELTILDIGFQLLSALDYLKTKKVLHRDLKPGNVFMVGNGNVKIGDFGISKVLSTTSMYAFSLMGTPSYIAPELMVGQPYSFGVDLWALGCILYEMAALHPPFVASNFMALVLQITNGKYDPLPTQYSPALSGVVNSLLVQDPHDR
eukprot:RCo012781